MRVKFKKKYFFLAFCLLLVAYLFWGPLFPWSPFKFGYKKIEFSKATVYITEYNGDSAVNKLDESIPEEEKFQYDKNDERDRDLQKILGTDDRKLVGEPGHGGPACQAGGNAGEERHCRQCCQDRRNPDVADHESVDHPADHADD